MKEKTSLGSKILSLVFAVLSVFWLVPIFLTLINSFKSNNYVNLEAFALPNSESFVGWANYIKGMTFDPNHPFWEAAWFSFFITVASVLLILLFCSMTAWYIVRVKSKAANIFYYLCLFSMIVPFQMVMFTMSKVANTLGLENPIGIVLLYLGFGAGLSVFMLGGFVRGIPLALEEAAELDGCTPLKMFFLVVLPLLKPITITVAVLNAMWIWNDYLLPYLVLGNRLKTIPVAIELAMQGAFGAVDLGGLMAMLILAIAPILAFYIFAQRYVIEGITAGAVKG